MKPIYRHDCDKCVYLGTVRGFLDRDEKDIDTYICVSKVRQSLSSIIGRYSDDEPDYASSLPPEAFGKIARGLTHGQAFECEYLQVADRWYLFAIIQAMNLGLYKFPQDHIDDSLLAALNKNI